MSKRQTVAAGGSSSSKFSAISKTGKVLLFTNENLYSLTWTSVPATCDLYFYSKTLGAHHRVNGDLVPVSIKNPLDPVHKFDYIIFSLSEGLVGTDTTASPALIARTSRYSNVYFIGDMTVRYGFDYELVSKQRSHNVEFLGYVGIDPNRQVKRPKQIKTTDLSCLFDKPQAIIDMVDANVKRNKTILAKSGFFFHTPEHPKPKKIGIFKGRQLTTVPIRSVLEVRFKGTTVKSREHYKEHLLNKNRRLVTINKTKHCGPYNWVLNRVEDEIETVFQKQLKTSIGNANKHKVKQVVLKKTRKIVFDLADYPHFFSHPSCEHIDFAFRLLFSHLDGDWDDCHSKYTLTERLGVIHRKLIDKIDI
jgi:hypothetical protein